MFEVGPGKRYQSIAQKDVYSSILHKFDDMQMQVNNTPSSVTRKMTNKQTDHATQFTSPSCALIVYCGTKLSEPSLFSTENSLKAKKWWPQ